MLYRLYVYKLTVAAASALPTNICNCDVSENSIFAWEKNKAAQSMAHFDTQEIAAKICALAGEKCRVSVRKLSLACGDVEYLYIMTSYAHAPAVLPSIHFIAAENDLVLYDAETKKTFFRELVNRTFIRVKSRIADYKSAINAEMKPVWRIRKIGGLEIRGDYDYAYVVTLRKDLEKTFSDRCADFYRCLRDQLRDDEKLNTDNECFTIAGERYTISFCLEGYKKHANQMGYYAQGLPQTKLIRRMGCEEGFFWLQQNQIDFDTVGVRMNFKEMRWAYPNPAERFIASVSIQKWESQEELGIRYCGCGLYGGEILFHVVPSGFFEDEKEISVLAIDEDRTWYLLSAVGKFYPYFGERYYLQENHLPIEMWADIVEEVRKEKEELLGNHNYREAEVLDVFIRWSESQLNLYRFHDDGRMLNIQGP